MIAYVKDAPRVGQMCATRLIFIATAQLRGVSGCMAKLMGNRFNLGVTDWRRGFVAPSVFFQVGRVEFDSLCVPEHFTNACRSSGDLGHVDIPVFTSGHPSNVQVNRQFFVTELTAKTRSAGHLKRNAVAPCGPDLLVYRVMKGLLLSVCPS